MSFFMGCKKRDLSDGSRSINGEDCKTVRKEYDNINSMSIDVFADGLSRPGYATILVNCLKNTERQLNQLYTL